ncbi:DUF680 domain-containing protein [Mesorhizobium sp. AR10]|uniref:DUF680 domain-containing protein n=1 Tax=Mesorhizobium sp. AR10 TaxID=2865839 RepID=UPI002160AEB9|nr:DUF680 domain-containing protein [Mesorhizobium sp. AR10]UVK37925.1 DUF680 domain-containing protein [Mesorhizobium sp. AR10]
MKKIALTAAAILVATGTAFAAGSDHYGNNNANQPSAAVDTTMTASTKTSDASVQKPLIQGADRNLFGNH